MAGVPPKRTGCPPSITLAAAQPNASAKTAESPACYPEGGLFMKRLLGLTVLVCSTLLTTPLRATGEIRILRGTFVQPANSPGRFDFDGTLGLEMEGTVEPHFAYLPWEECWRLTCDPGEVVSVRSIYGTRHPVLTGTGDLTLLGHTYRLWTLTGGEAFADLQFDADLTLPEFSGTGLTDVSVPFVFSGALYVSSGLDPDIYEVYELSGSGVATVTLAPHPFGFTSWIIVRTSYEFQPRGDVTSKRNVR
jgi:hypothetical protein